MGSSWALWRLSKFRSKAHSAKGEATAGRMTHAGARKKTEIWREWGSRGVGGPVERATAFSRKLGSETVLVGKVKSTY